MFDYDRLSLDVKQQFSKAASIDKDNNKDKETMSNGSSETQLFGWDSPDPVPDDENSIVHGLSELLRRCSSPGRHQQQHFASPQQKNAAASGQQQYQRHRSATIGNANEQMYSAMISAHQQTAHRHKTIGNALSMDLNEQQANRRLSGGSINFSEMFDCGASSGYGSPGAVGTPLASPASAANSAVQYIAHQLQKMFVDQGFCEGMMPGTTPVKCAAANAPSAGAIPILPLNTPPTCGGAGGGALSTPPGATPVLVKATTTTTGTNKNSNKRKTSIANGGAATSPGPENIVATEDGFDNSEIAEFAELLTSPKRSPPPRYVCHICYQPGHYISDCPQRFNTPYEELTPYQGRKKCYGEFQCEQCKRKWTSQNSVANEAQSCIKCHVPVFPHKQLPVDKAIALGLVKLQRLSVTPGTTTPTPPLMVPGGQKQQPLSAQAVRNAVEDAIYFGLKNGTLANSPTAMTQLAI